MSKPALHILSLMDGRHTCEAISRAFQAEFGQPVSTDMLGSMVDALEQAHFLEGPTFESFYQSRLEAYRRAGVRPMRDAQALGIADDSGDLFQDMLAQVDRSDSGPLPGPVLGLVAPHLDYPRGALCYAAAYATLQDRVIPDCVVILGTNHFGRSCSVVSTASDFETPLGTTKSDTDLIDRLETHCGSLRSYELDHACEHSIELQVAWLQYLFGADKFRVAAFLCPDPCGPTGTTPFDGCGVDLRDFSEALRDLIDADTEQAIETPRVQFGGHNPLTGPPHSAPRHSTQPSYRGLVHAGSQPRQQVIEVAGQMSAGPGERHRFDHNAVGRTRQAP